jgi:hypothetical protein
MIAFAKRVKVILSPRILLLSYVICFFDGSIASDESQRDNSICCCQRRVLTVPLSTSEDSRVFH